MTTTCPRCSSEPVWHGEILCPLCLQEGSRLTCSVCGTRVEVASMHYRYGADLGGWTFDAEARLAFCPACSLWHAVGGKEEA